MTDATRTVKEAGFYGQMAPWGKCVDWLGSADGQYSGWVKGFTMAHICRLNVEESGTSSSPSALYFRSFSIKTLASCFGSPMAAARPVPMVLEAFRTGSASR